nr:elongator complex protein 2 [Cryptococcus depauperatus CBS 7841]
MRVLPEYISVGSNRSSSCAACDNSGILFFGAGKLIAIWDTTTSRGIYATLPGHKGQVTTVKLLQDGRLVTGDEIGDVRMWQEINGVWECRIDWEAHRGASISAIGVSKTAGIHDDLLFTGGSDGLVKRWRLGDTKAEETQKMDLKGRLPLDLEIGYLPGSEAPILAMGCTDRRIQIWALRGDFFLPSLWLEGHEDWIRCLSLTPYPSASSSSVHDLLLASGSQDNFIRLWRISAISLESAVSNAENEGLEMLDEFEKRLAGEAGGNVQISTKAHILSVQDGERSLRYNITLEALLVGHDSGLTNVRWSQNPLPILLSTASDNSLMVWQPSASSTFTDGIWVPTSRFGAIGGRGLAFYGAAWGKDGKSVMAGGWNGGWEVWVEGEKGVWEVRSGLTGHFGDVQSITWDTNGEYLLSVSSDKTSRIHAQCKIPVSQEHIWTEIARPQIHGYDLSDCSFISPFLFVSAADEKVVRVFDAPDGFVKTLTSLGASKRKRHEVDIRPKGATVPPLGLSNRALQKAPRAEDVIEKQGQNEAIISISHTFTTLPTEEELATSTLWPEVEKVYGHGYELVCVAASHAGDFIATACKATNAEHAVIRIVSTSTWEPVGQPLAGHTLTITRIAFSPDDQKILSSSRDRGWRIYQRSGEEYELLAGEEKAHARMVLDACWGDNGGMFATASRDKTIKIWMQAVENGSQWMPRATIKFNEAATAVDIISYEAKELLAAGTESGSMSIYILRVTENVVEADLLTTFEPRMSHVGAVNRLAWRKLAGSLSLASCSEDRSVRVFGIQL